jgi:hypothetical protein
MYTSSFINGKTTLVVSIFAKELVVVPSLAESEKRSDILAIKIFTAQSTAAFLGFYSNNK